LCKCDVHIICSRPATASIQPEAQQGVRDTTQAYQFWMPASTAALAQQPLACTDGVETLGLWLKQFPNRAAQGCGKEYLPGLSQRLHIVMGTADCAVAVAPARGCMDLTLHCCVQADRAHSASISAASGENCNTCDAPGANTNLEPVLVALFNRSASSRSAVVQLTCCILVHTDP
jgi:hypothetical protein